MSDYTLAVNWSGKDALADSDSAKVISGSDFNTEFTTIQTSIATKADLVDATQNFTCNDAAITGTLDVTGVPTVPTQTAGNNTTRVATTAYVTTAVANNHAFPVGAIFTTTVAYANSAAVVAVIGGTTWAAFGAGKVLVGLDSSDTDFDTVGSSTGSAGSGGTKTHTLTTGEIPAHTHPIDVATRNTSVIDSNTIHDPSFGSAGVTTRPTNENTGGGGAHANVQPYIVVYFWKRTA